MVNVTNSLTTKKPRCQYQDGTIMRTCLRQYHYVKCNKNEHQVGTRQFCLNLSCLTSAHTCNLTTFQYLRNIRTCVQSCLTLKATLPTGAQCLPPPLTKNKSNHEQAPKNRWKGRHAFLLLVHSHLQKIAQYSNVWQKLSSCHTVEIAKAERKLMGMQGQTHTKSYPLNQQIPSIWLTTCPHVSSIYPPSVTLSWHWHCLHRYDGAHCAKTITPDSKQLTTNKQGGKIFFCQPTNRYCDLSHYNRSIQTKSSCSNRLVLTLLALIMVLSQVQKQAAERNEFHANKGMQQNDMSTNKVVCVSYCHNFSHASPCLSYIALYFCMCR